MQQEEKVDRNCRQLIFAIVGPTGADLKKFRRCLSRALATFNIKPIEIQLSNRISKDMPSSDGKNSIEILNEKMSAGTAFRAKAKDPAILAKYAASEIFHNRPKKNYHERVAFILHQLKRPEEVKFLRDTYGSIFFLIGVSDKVENQLDLLTNKKKNLLDSARKLIRRDQYELESDGVIDEKIAKEFGQKTRDTFQLSDFFVDGSEEDNLLVNKLVRYLDILHNSPIVGPNRDEYFMYLAQSSALRSGDLSRQVGAVVISESGEVSGVGVNDVPKSDGGQYWEGDDFDFRDRKLGFDANRKELNELLVETHELLKPLLASDSDLNRFLVRMKRSRINDITEYGRPVHAEMSAILACARSGTSTAKGRIYCTTYPCHNCAKHIVAAGIREVYYIEPYPKSMAAKLHRDSLIDEVLEPCDTVMDVSIGSVNLPNFVRFKPFIGVSPRRFLDLFSMNLGRGDANVRKDVAGNLITIDRITAPLRFCTRIVTISGGESEAIDDVHVFESGMTNGKEKVESNE